MAFAAMRTLTIISTYPEICSTWLSTHSKGGSVRHVTLRASVSFIHPHADQNKNQKVSVVKNIIKVINLYLNRPLRVFSPYARWKRQRTRPSCSLSALCNSVCVDPFWDLWGGGSWTGSKPASRVPVSKEPRGWRLCSSRGVLTRPLL